MIKFILTLTLVFVVIFSNAQSLTDSLIAYYPFNGNTNDSSGNNNNGTANGPILTSDRFGHQNAAYSFDGINDFIEVANNTSLDLGTNFSFSFWFYQDSSISTGYRIFDKNTAGIPDGYGVDTYGTSSGKLIRLYSGSTLNNMTTDHTLKTWHHVVITYDGNTLKFYLNNNLENSVTLSAHNPPQNNLPLVIGCGQLGSTRQNFFKGSIDELRIYGRTLNTSDIQKLFTENILSVDNIGTNVVPQALAYPNPTTGVIHLLNNDYTIEKVTDITGKQILVDNLTANTINIIGANSIYFVYIKNVNTNYSHIIKVIKN